MAAFFPVPYRADLPKEYKEAVYRAAVAAFLKANEIEATEVPSTQRDPAPYRGLCGLSPEEKTARKREMGKIGSQHLQRLSPTEEQSLADAVDEADAAARERGDPQISQEAVLQMAMDVLRARGDTVAVGKGWYYAFLGRNPELKARRAIPRGGRRRHQTPPTRSLNTTTPSDKDTPCVASGNHHANPPITTTTKTAPIVLSTSTSATKAADATTTATPKDTTAVTTKDTTKDTTTAITTTATANDTTTTTTDTNRPNYGLTPEIVTKWQFFSARGTGVFSQAYAMLPETIIAMVAEQELLDAAEAEAEKQRRQARRAKPKAARASRKCCARA